MRIIPLTLSGFSFPIVWVFFSPSFLAFQKWIAAIGGQFEPRSHILQKDYPLLLSILALHSRSITSLTNLIFWTVLKRHFHALTFAHTHPRTICDSGLNLRSFAGPVCVLPGVRPSTAVTFALVAMKINWPGEEDEKKNRTRHSSFQAARNNLHGSGFRTKCSNNLCHRREETLQENIWTQYRSISQRNNI